MSLSHLVEAVQLHPRGRIAVLTQCLLPALLAAFLVACQQPQQDNTKPPPPAWPMGGQNYRNTRSNPTQTTVNPTNANRLALKWTFRTHGDVSATAAVVDGTVYFPDWAGYVYSLDAKTGAQKWAHQLPPVNNIQTVSRTSPAVQDGKVFIGDQIGNVIALDAATGAELWRRKPNPGPSQIITAGMVVREGVVYVGSASSEEGTANDPNYPCCSARGSLQALDAATGTVLWQTFMVPQGYSGGAIWSTTPALDPASDTVFVTTGNNYSVPAAVKECQLAAGTDPTAEEACLSPDNHIDSIVALKMSTGQIKWARRLWHFDDWTVGCYTPNHPNCPENEGPDFDFGAGANLFTVNGKLVVGAGQKSGMYWALDAATGATLWNTQVGPSSLIGGILWGTATDGQRVYVPIVNKDRKPYPNHPELGDAGSIAALDVATGATIWQIRDPEASLDQAAVSVSNGVLYAGSMSGYMYALDAATGAILFSYKGEGSSNAGPAIDNEGTVYWGNGYKRFNQGTPSTTFYAFSLDGK